MQLQTFTAKRTYPVACMKRQNKPISELHHNTSLTSIMNKPDMIHQSLQDSMSKFDAHKSAQKSVHLLDYSSSISYDQTHDTCTDLKDRTAFSHKFAEEIAEIAELQCLIKESNYYINMLYTYRSLSKPLPMIPADLSDTKKSNLYLTVFNILTPNI
eukprot:1106524_1